MSGAHVGRNAGLVGMKYCASDKCPAVNPQLFSEFHRNKSQPDGYHSYCKVCRKTQASKYADHKREYDAGRYQVNGQAVRDRMKQCHAENPEPGRARARAWSAAHPEHRDEYRDRFNELRRTPKGRAQGRKDGHKRRARMQQAGIEDFQDQEIFERDGWTCQICGLAVDPELKWPDRMSKSLDHIIPILLGGAHTRANTQLAHLICNIIKGNKEHALARRKGGVLIGSSGN